MSNKPGRKALFTGPVVPGVTEQDDGAVVLPEAIEAALHAALEGNDSVQIDLAGVPENYRPLATSINALLEKKLEEKQRFKHKMAETEMLLKGSDTIIQQNPMPMLIVNPDFKITLANAAYVDMSGISMDRVVGMNLRDFKVVTQKGSGLRQALQEKKRIYGEVTVELPSGVHTLEQYGIPLLDNEGAIESILIIYDDLTKQREGEEEIQAQIANIAELQRRSETIIQRNP
ncbi:MAG: PAS domain-containing protein, partial [Syntrophorhabdaceae bacterium]